MADATYDAVIIGGGNKALVIAMYLAKYGGMSVGLFEKRHEAGGGWTTEEGAAPGFLADYHASQISPGYQIPVEQDFPEWKELGGVYLIPRANIGAIFKEDNSCVILYSAMEDKTQEHSAKSIARFSQRDADTWMRLTEQYRRVIAPVYLEFLHTPPPPPGEPDALERLAKDPNSGVDPSWMAKSPLEVFQELFESDAFIAFLLRSTYSAIPCSPDMSGMGFMVLLFAIASQWTCGVAGGTHNWAHAAAKIILANGGKIFTKQEVDKVIIENGTAKSIRLTDGTEVQARKLVISTLDPYTLCFRLIGKEYFDSQILRRVENLERRITCITWYTWALREHPRWKAANFDPDINETVFVYLTNKNPEALIKERAVLSQGKMPEFNDLQIEFMNHSLYDKLRMPEGRSAVLTEQFVLPANALSEREWLEFKKSHAEDVMKLWQEYSTNITWDSVIGYVPFTPYDCCELANMGPTGNWAVIDNIAGQMGTERPVPELARYRTPIKNLYATGSGWHPHGNGACWPAYCCYKVIAQDLGLDKPWEKAGRPW